MANLTKHPSKEYIKPKTLTMEGRQYYIFGVVNRKNPELGRAIAQVKTKYGFKDVQNLALQKRLFKKVIRK